MKPVFGCAALVIFVTSLPAVAAIPAAAPATAPRKLWASDLPAFLNDRPGHWIVGRSDHPALSAQEAELLARSDAARAIVPLIAQQVKRPIEAKALAARVEASLFRDDWLVDREVKAVERPYGTIWSAAVLVDASPRRIEMLVRQIEHQTRERHARAVVASLALFIVGTIVGSAYVFLNWITRGFFRGRLAVASVLIVASAVLGVVNLL